MTSKTDKGNYIGMVSSFTKADGSQGEMADVWFGKDKTAAPAMADLLAAPSADLLTGPAAATITPATGSVAPRALAQLRGSLEDELRNNGPLV